MVRKILMSVMVCMVLAFTSVGSGDVFNMGSGLTSLEFVPVGDAGNAGEGSGTGYITDLYDLLGPGRICGAVNYRYNMGKYEITAGQYTAFLNAVAATDTYSLYNTQMWSDTYELSCKIQRTGASGSYVYTVASAYANRPTNYVTLGSTLRFCNWLTNGQPTGSQNASTTEDGSYTLAGLSDEQLMTVARNPGGLYFVPTEDEWYKAAYYDPAKPGGPGYWDFATGSDTAPGHDINETTNAGNNANYYYGITLDQMMLGEYGNYTIGSPYYRTVGGEFEQSGSYYGTFDQTGNLLEWICPADIYPAPAPYVNDGVTYNTCCVNMRDGCFMYPIELVSAPSRMWMAPIPGWTSWGIGFRVTKLPSVDFNEDSAVDGFDINALYAAINGGGTNMAFDLTGDDVVDQLDMDVLIHDILHTHYGDADLNGEVDGDDYDALVNGYLFGIQEGMPAWSQGDFDGNGEVDGDDYDLLVNGYLGID
jgi:formylglycine-generating enzyme